MSDTLLEKTPWIIAEAGVNHNGDLDTARRLVDVAVGAGADAVKFQTFTADKLATRDADKADYQKETTESDESQFEMLRRLELSEKHHRQLVEHCEEQDITFLSTPFDKDSADFLETLDVRLFKIGSGDLTNIPLIKHVARKGRPLIVSTGMSDLSEVEAAVQAVEETGNQQLYLLHCVSEYPTEPSDVHLRSMNTLKTAFGYPVGFSDHTLGIEIPLAATALGAEVIEKHFTLDRSLPGPDHRASLEPDELEALVSGIRKVRQALGNPRKSPTEGEREVARVVRKSIVATTDIEEGQRITEEMIGIRRPGTGLKPAMLDQVVQRVAATDIPEGTLVERKMLK